MDPSSRAAVGTGADAPVWGSDYSSVWDPQDPFSHFHLLLPSLQTHWICWSNREFEFPSRGVWFPKSQSLLGHCSAVSFHRVLVTCSTHLLFLHVFASLGQRDFNPARSHLVWLDAGQEQHAHRLKGEMHHWERKKKGGGVGSLKNMEWREKWIIVAARCSWGNELWMYRKGDNPSWRNLSVIGVWNSSRQD